MGGTEVENENGDDRVHEMRVYVYIWPRWNFFLGSGKEGLEGVEELAYKVSKEEIAKPSGFFFSSRMNL